MKTQDVAATLDLAPAAAGLDPTTVGATPAVGGRLATNTRAFRAQFVICAFRLHLQNSIIVNKS
jgi:hypothetical protein